MDDRDTQAHSFRPSTKILYLLIACVLTVGLITFAAKYSPAPRTVTKTSDTYIAQNNDVSGMVYVLQSAAATDQDDDGLKDWEEALWKTDPTKADTDGDGTPDGAEVEAGRNPLVALKTGPKGQDDKLSATAALNTATKTIVPEANLTETDKFGRELFAKYMAAKKAGSLDQNQLIQELVNEKAGPDGRKQYRETDFIVIPRQNTTVGTVRDYGNALGLALGSYSAAGVPNEFETIQKAIKNQSPSALSDLDPVILGYQNILHDFLKVQVPRSMVVSHLDLLNAIGNVLTDVQGFKKTFKDPIVGLMSLNQYPGDIESLKAAIQNMRAAFEQQGIVFEQSEYGYILVHAI